MAIQNRNFIAGQTYFIYQKGRTCDASFFDEACFQFYRVRLLNSVNNFHIRLHAYSLLAREFYLLLTPGTPNGVNRLLHALNESYSEYFNNRFDRSVSVWSGKCLASLVQGDGLVLDSQKFIERAGMQEQGLDHPGVYPWSSYCANSFGGRSRFLEPHRAVVDFIDSRCNGLKQYRKFIALPFPDAYEMYLVSTLKFGRDPAKRPQPLARARALKRRYRPRRQESAQTGLLL